MATQFDQPAKRGTPEQTAAEPSLQGRLREVLPPWTHWGGSLFSPFTATWTTTDGTWSITGGGFTGPSKLMGPGGTWAFSRKDADHIIGVLRALGAIPETPADPTGYPAGYGRCAQCGAQPGQWCVYIAGDGTKAQEPGARRPEAHFYRDSPDDDPNWRNLIAYKAPGTGSADPEPPAAAPPHAPRGKR